MTINLYLFYLSLFSGLIILLLIQYSMLLPAFIVYLFINFTGVYLSLKLKEQFFSVLALKTVITLSFLPFLIYALGYYKSILMLILFLSVFYIIFFDSLTNTLFQKKNIETNLHVTANISFLIPNLLVVFSFVLLRDLIAVCRIIMLVSVIMYYLIIIAYTMLNKKQFQRLYILNKEINLWKNQ